MDVLCGVDLCRILAAVKRLLLFVFVLLMPFQFVWAAAAMACMHEKDPSANHLGHHSAAGESQVLDEDNQFTDTQTADNCQICHLAAIKMNGAHSDQPIIIGTTPRCKVDATPPALLTSRRHDRPKWATAV